MILSKRNKTIRLKLDMKIEFLSRDSPAHEEAQEHIKSVYLSAYGAIITDFAPMLVVARRAEGKILCAAGIRTARDGFFSDAYLASDFPTALRQATGTDTPSDKIMEVVSLASTTPFPILPMLDKMVEWGYENGMTCGVFTATKPLRRLLTRAGLQYVELASAHPSMVSNSQAWGAYYDTDPKVCALTQPVVLSPRARTARLLAEAS